MVGFVLFVCYTRFNRLASSSSFHFFCSVM